MTSRVRPRRASSVPTHVLTDPDLARVLRHRLDASLVRASRASSCVPASTDEVAAVVRRAARAHGVPLVPQGGNTGLVGGGVPRGDGAMVVLSTTRLTRLDPVETATARAEVVAGAGVTLADLDAHARARRLAVRRRPRGARHRDDRRHRRDQRRRAARRRSRRHPRAGARRRGGARRRIGRVAARRSREGQRRLRPQPAARRQRGHPRRRHGGAGAARARCRERAPQVTLVGLPDVAAALPLLQAARADRGRDASTTRACARCARSPALPLPTAQHWPVYLLLETAELPDAPRRRRRRRRRPDVGLPRPPGRGRRLARRAAQARRVPAGRRAARVRRRAARRALAARRRRRRARSSTATSATATCTSTCSACPRTTRRSTRRCCTLVAEHHGSIAAEHGVGVAKIAWLHLSRPTPARDRRAMRAADQPGVLLPSTPRRRTAREPAACAVLGPWSRAAVRPTREVRRRRRTAGSSPPRRERRRRRAHARRLPAGHRRRRRRARVRRAADRRRSPRLRARPSGRPHVERHAVRCRRWSSPTSPRSTSRRGTRRGTDPDAPDRVDADATATAVRC